MITKNQVIFVLSVLLFILVSLHLNKDEVVKEVIKTVVKYDTITNVVDNTKPTKIVIKEIKVPITKYDTITDTVIDTIYKDKKVKEYTYTNTFENGRLKSVILADHIYNRDIEFTSFNKESTTNTTTTIVQSNLFVGMTTSLNLDKTVDNAVISGYYVRKNKWLINAGLGYSVTSNKPIVSMGFALKF